MVTNDKALQSYKMKCGMNLNVSRVSYEILK